MAKAVTGVIVRGWAVRYRDNGEWTYFFYTDDWYSGASEEGKVAGVRLFFALEAAENWAAQLEDAEVVPVRMHVELGANS